MTTTSTDAGTASNTTQNIQTPSQGTAGGSAGIAAPLVGAQAPAGATSAGPSAVFFPENWKEGLGEEFKADPTISKYGTVPELAKAHVNLQKMMGRDKIALPDKHATPDDWKGVFQKLGLPEKPESYEVNVPQDTFDPAFLKEFKQQAFENNILPKQAEKLLGWYANLQKQQQQQTQQQADNSFIQSKEQLKKEWGEAFDSKKIKAETAAKRFFNAQGVDFLEKSGLANNVHFAKAMAAVGELLQEHGIKGNPASYTGLTPADAKQRINEINSNKAHPYWQASHANHRAAVDEMAMLYRAQFPES